MDDEEIRLKDMASRAREMARWILNQKDKETLLGIAKDYERKAAAAAAKK